ncbi:hypothetical protein P153DRAFT_371309 [Dothidotthia symphoricarpi CBS 119687]|uniref:Uncharacterized protein n=1 Tax=Dothidotthia symphoricarpi CBS 119687 TaxID=1392245 RepID=A0A6A5ZZZ2_9PLEO|nr:uncharacterized protein P153DRAFT_371309 [Dothidotthia symphoricarpi CBS 119687]KAF2124008.1 hypothetical protein P153DRAFT_371309 [Dothidotthia symphoricarpi CBS 119687]
MPERLPSKPTRKRRKQAGDEHATKDRMTDADSRDGLKQRYVSEGFRVTKATGRRPASRAKTSTVEVSQPPSAPTCSPQSIFNEDLVPDNTQNVDFYCVSHGVAENRHRADPKDYSQDTLVASTSRTNADMMSFDLNANHHDTNDHTHLDFSWPNYQGDDSIFSGDEFNDDLDDEDLMKLSSDVEDSSGRHAKDRLSGISANSPIVVDEPGSPGHTKKKFVSPVTLTTRLLAATGDARSIEDRKPIVRSPFPSPVRDRSPIIGLSSNMLLKTCFRIGEAINQGHLASKAGKHVMLELYARVLSSERDDAKQDFVLCDLFHAKPPYIKAVYDATIWKQVQLFNYDSQRLLQEGRICRCMGKMKCEKKEWVMTVSNVWEATWEDIQWVEGIVNA